MKKRIMQYLIQIFDFVSLIFFNELVINYNKILVIL